MKKFYFQLCVAACSIVFLMSSASSVEDASTRFKKHPEIQQIKPKKPVKVKLKRSAEGKYSWELSGDDVDEIVKADKRLRKLLGTQ